MNTTTLLETYFDKLENHYKRYRQRRKLSFILLGLACLVILTNPYSHSVLAAGFGFLLCGSSLYLFITAEKMIKSVMDALGTDIPGLSTYSMSSQEGISYLQMKTALTEKIIDAIDIFP